MTGIDMQWLLVPAEGVLRAESAGSVSDEVAAGAAARLVRLAPGVFSERLYMLYIMRLRYGLSLRQ